jgi:hypothetical protein
MKAPKDDGAGSMLDIINGRRERAGQPPISPRCPVCGARNPFGTPCRSQHPKGIC